MAYFKSIYTCSYGYKNGLISYFVACCPTWLILSDNWFEGGGAMAAAPRPVRLW